MTWTVRWLERISREKITSCVVVQNETLRVAHYKNRKAAVKLHKLNSITKSVISALVGVCLQKG